MDTVVPGQARLQDSFGLRRTLGSEYLDFEGWLLTSAIQAVL